MLSESLLIPSLMHLFQTMDTAGSRVKLSDILTDEMTAFSKDRGKRRAAVRRILTDRGLGHVAPSLNSKYYIGGSENAADLSRRKDLILQKVKERTKKRTSYVEDDVISYINSCRALCTSGFVKETVMEKDMTVSGHNINYEDNVSDSDSTVTISSEAGLQKAQSCIGNIANVKELSAALQYFPSLNDPDNSMYTFTSSSDFSYGDLAALNSTGSSSEWKFGKNPTITVTPPLSGIDSSDVASVGPTTVNTCPCTSHDETDIIAISWARGMYQKMISEANSLTKNILMSNKWKVMSYLSGNQKEEIHGEIPDWYGIVRDFLTSPSIDEKLKLHDLDII